MVTLVWIAGFIIVIILYTDSSYIGSVAGILTQEKVLIDLRISVGSNNSSLKEFLWERAALTTMTNIRCPSCNSTKLEERSALHAAMLKVKNPESPPLEVRVKIYTCLECEREFTEREARSNNLGGGTGFPSKE